MLSNQVCAKAVNYMSDSPLSLDMLVAAKRDMKALSNMLDSEQFDDHTFGFHAQQAIEKALKAWLLSMGGDNIYTHDLGYLLGKLEELGADIDTYWPFLDLTNYAVRFRYETIPDDEEPLDRSALVSEVGDLVAHVSRLIDPEK